MKIEFDPLYRPSQPKFGKIHNYIPIFTSRFSESDELLSGFFSIKRAMISRQMQ